ncbi:MAG: Nif3-like dinuclear metal center hexameric protein [Bacteroidota bacterium]
MPTVRDITAALDRWAPEAQKADFDRVGLQVGDPSREVTRVLVALDLTPAVVDEAVETGAEMIVTHHPLIFQPLARLTPTDFVSGLAFRLAQESIAYAAIHTNLDAQPGGVSFALAKLLGVREATTLAPESGMLKKLVVFTPRPHAEAVRRAMAEAGAGQIGDYRDCSFSSEGTGRFRPTEGTDPHVGTIGEVHAEPEERIEVLVESWALGRVIRAMEAAHPYEEVAYDVYPVEQSHRTVGYGAVGTLDEPLGLDAFLAHVADRLGSGSLRYTAEADAVVSRVAVCGGSGMSFFKSALASGADAYVTADVTYHRFFEPLAPSGRARIALIDAGHYETEWITEQLIVDHLATEFHALEVGRTTHRTSPMQTFTP